MKTFLLIALAVLLFICLAHVPYSYFIFVRLIATITFIYLLSYEIKKKEKKESIIIALFILVVLFQPLLRIPLGRGLWNIIDIIVGIGLIIYAIKEA